MEIKKEWIERMEEFIEFDREEIARILIRIEIILKLKKKKKESR